MHRLGRQPSQSLGFPFALFMLTLSTFAIGTSEFLIVGVQPQSK